MSLEGRATTELAHQDGEVATACAAESQRYRARVLIFGALLHPAAESKRFIK
jgi:hypothetical protein